MKDFPNVDKLIELANSNPKALEELRKKQVDMLIDGAPEHMRRRLRGLQFQIDCKREVHKDSPMGSCVAITRMMMESLQSLNEALHGYVQPSDAKAENTQDLPNQVIPFPAAAN